MPTRREREKLQLKDKIFSTVLTIAREESWSKVTIRKVARTIEYSTMVLYNLFGSKENLFIELKESGFTKLNSIYQKVRISADQPKKAVLALSNATLDFYMENRELYQIMFGIVGLRAVSTGCREGSDESVAKNLVLDLLGNVLDGDPNILFLNWWAINQGFISMAESTDEQELPFLKTAFEESVKRFLAW